MTHQTLPANAPESAKHIVDELIEERCPSFTAHWSWPLVRQVLFRLLGYRKAVDMVDELAPLPGAEAFDRISDRLALKLDTRHLDRIPETGRCVIAANHPTGLADGVAVWDAVRQRRPDVLFFANADALRVSPNLSDVIIPVEWVMEKRTNAKTRETLRRAAEAFQAEKCIVIFPSGIPARLVDGTIEEGPWFPTYLSLARKHNAPLIPLGVGGRNSRLYFLLARLSRELRDITLFNELINKRGRRFEITAGLPIDPAALTGDISEINEIVREYTTHDIGRDASKTLLT